MNKLFLLILATSLFIGCSKYEEFHEHNKTLHIEDMETDLPIIDIRVNRNHFDDIHRLYDKGIEIEGKLSLYRNGKQIINNEEIEIEIKGSHSSSFKLKSLGIEFEDAFDNSTRKLLNPDVVLPRHSLDKIKSFRLRNSGNDFLNTMIKDISYTQLAIEANLNLDYGYSEQSVVFVNGEFWGLMNIRSEANAKGVSRLNEVKTENVTLLKIINPGEIIYKNGDFGRLDNFLAAVKSGDIDYLLNEIDVENFIDYLAFQTFIANDDWPYNNVRMYAIDGGPFRFVVFDLDFCNTYRLDDKPITFIRVEKKNMVTDLFNVLYKNEKFKTNFQYKLNTLAYTNLLSKDKFNKIIDRHKNRIENLMPFQIRKYKTPTTMAEWYQQIEILKFHYRKRTNSFN